MSKRQIGASILASKLKCNNFGFSRHKKTPIFLEKGSILHDMLENMKEDGKFTYNKKGSKYYEQTTLYVHKHPFEEYEETVRDYYNNNPHFFIAGLGEEHVPELKFVKDFNAKYTIRGAIDRPIFKKDEAILIDWKSGQNAISMVDVNDEKSIVQAVVYSWYIFTEYENINKITFRWEYIEMGKSRAIEFTRDQLLYLKVLIIKYIFILENGGLKVNSSCPFCANKSKCPLILYPVLKDTTEMDLEELIPYLKKIKIVEKAITGIVQESKEKIKHLPGGQKHFGARSYNYLIMNDKVPLDLKLSLLGDSFKVSKKAIKEYKELYGELDIVERKSEVFKL